jgi:O-antigen/teichoic acid export membrane protein
MALRLRTIITQRLFQGSERSKKTKKNIVALFLLRGFSVAINLFLVPLTLTYLNRIGYGIWTTLTSIIGWVTILDIGLGNGLRNEFARALALGDRKLARSQVSTTYACVAAIVVLLVIMFFAAHPFLRWSWILNAPAEMEGDLSCLAASVFVFFCLRLLFGLIGTVLLADQQPALSSLLDVANSAIALLAVYVLTRVSSGSLFFLGSTVSLIAAAVPFAASLFLFRGRYRDVAPAFRYVRPEQGRTLMGLGLKFFALQVSGIVIFASSNLIIAQLFGPAEVTPYNIAFRYYGIALTAFTVLLTPFWSAYTEAFTMGDIRWITMTVHKLKQSFGILVVVLLIMTLIADRFYLLWVGTEVTVPLRLSLAMAAYVLIVAWSSIFVYFINGTGKIRLQLSVAPAAALVFIPLAILFAARLGLGPAGVMMAVCLCLLPGCFLWPIQMRKVLAGRATGIWAR